MEVIISSYYSASSDAYIIRRACGHRGGKRGLADKICVFAVILQVSVANLC
jgi:hypothetical protein